MVSSKAIANSSLVLRILAPNLLAASVVVMVTNTFTDAADDSKTNFTIFITYRYVVAVGIVGFVYTLIQIPFSVYHVCTDKRWIRNGCLPIFDFYGDKVISFLIASAVGAGFAVTYEFRQIVQGLLGDGSSSNKFFDKVYISVGLLSLGFICMATLSILSSIVQTTTPTPAPTKRSFFFG